MGVHPEVSSSTGWDELAHVRRSNGQFDVKSHSQPEVGLGSAGAIVLESPVSDRERNFWVKLEPGQTTQFHIADDGISLPGRSWTDDTLDLTSERGTVTSEFNTFADDDTASQLQVALDELDPVTAEELRDKIRSEISKHAGDSVAVVFDSGNMELRHTAAHDVDENGGVYTSNVMGRLESDDSYTYLRDGWYQLGVIAALAEYGYDS